MERTGPESLLVMAATRMVDREALGDHALWEIAVREEAELPRLLAAAPIAARARRRTGLLAWIGHLRDADPLRGF
jgi:hypothetical protein